MVRIPVEYQEVEYLESTGTQHINTEHLVQSEKIRIVASIITSASYGEQDLIGNQDSATGRFILGFYRYYVFLFARDSQGTEQNVVSETFPNEASNFIIDAVYDLQNGTKALSVNGEAYSGSHTRSIISTAKLKLFQNGQNSNKFVGKTRYLRIYEDDNLLFDFIPCYRKSDSEPGMYDTVSGTFFTNAGTGTFLVGNDVSWEAIDLLALRRMVMLSMANAVKVKTGSFIGDGTNVIDLNVGFEPDIVFCYAPNLDLIEAGWMGQQCAIIIKNVAAVQIRHNNETTATALSTANPHIGGDNPPYGNTVDSYNPYGSYTNGVFRLTNTTNNGLTRFINNEHYEWVAIKYS